MSESGSAGAALFEGQTVEFAEPVYVSGLGTIPTGNRGIVVFLYASGEASVKLNSYGWTAIVDSSKLKEVRVGG